MKQLINQPIIASRLIAVAEDNARRRKDKRWANYVEEAAPEDTHEEEKKDEGERKVKYETVIVTEVSVDAHIFVQNVDEGPKLEGLMGQLREEFSRSPPLAGAFNPKRGIEMIEMRYSRTPS